MTFPKNKPKTLSTFLMCIKSTTVFKLRWNFFIKVTTSIWWWSLTKETAPRSLCGWTDQEFAKRSSSTIKTTKAHSKKNPQLSVSSKEILTLSLASKEILTRRATTPSKSKTCPSNILKRRQSESALLLTSQGRKSKPTCLAMSLGWSSHLSWKENSCTWSSLTTNWPNSQRSSLVRIAPRSKAKNLAKKRCGQ